MTTNELVMAKGGNQLWEYLLIQAYGSHIANTIIEIALQLSEPCQYCIKSSQLNEKTKSCLSQPVERKISYLVTKLQNKTCFLDNDTGAWH